MSVNIVQCRYSDGRRVVAIVEGPTLRVVLGFATMYELANHAVAIGSSLEALLLGSVSHELLDYNAIYGGQSEWTLLAPIDHPTDVAHCLVTGTGLSHRKSADNRHAMHASGAADAPLTDSMRMYKLGEEGGRPASGRIGTAPEWFWKGDGAILRGHGMPLTVPNYGEDGGDEAEIAGIYLIGACGEVFRVGFAVVNEFSDHVMESRNYLCLAPSKLRQCAIGPEMVIGANFGAFAGETAVLRGGQPIWSQEISSGEANMVHSLANLEHHHFKYDQHRRAGDLHIHCFGTPGFSFGSGLRLDDGDVMSVQFDGFGRALSNPIHFDREPERLVEVRQA